MINLYKSYDEFLMNFKHVETVGPEPSTAEFSPNRFRSEHQGTAEFVVHVASLCALPQLSPQKPREERGIHCQMERTV